MSFLSPQFPNTHQPHEHGESTSPVLSEVFMTSSAVDRVRAEIPDQYQKHFDELRQAILSFCDEFAIPTSALSNKETLGTYLTSREISLLRMQEVSLLFERFEYLLAHKEPLGELSGALREVESLYHLREQYAAQMELLERIGVLKNHAITGIDGEIYPVPTLEQIAEHLCSPERKETFRVKRDQGFTKLLLVPFGMSLDIFIFTFRQFLLDYKKRHPSFARKDPAVIDITDVQNWDPFNIWDYFIKGDTGHFPNLLYHPAGFDRNIDEDGETKTNILEKQKKDACSTAGWRVLFLQPSDPTNMDSKGFASIPREKKGEIRGEDIPRPDLEAGETARNYLWVLLRDQKDPEAPYFGESGMVPEDWILAAMTHLQETGKLLDLFQDDKNDVINYLVGCFLPRDAYVPRFYCNRNAICLTADTPDNRLPSTGSRFVVVV